jgi:hypothetical protein
MSIREEVMELLVDTARIAEENGLDAIKEIERQYPGTPEMVVIFACAELDHRKKEAWWKQVEKTIDGEIIKKALATK